MHKEGKDRVVAGRVQHSTPSLFRNLRNLRVLVFHPRDADGEVLSQQLQRIGCQVITMWPPLPDLPDTVDVIFCAVGRITLRISSTGWARIDDSRRRLDQLRKPDVIDAAMRMGAVAMLTSPVRSSGILSSLAMAKQLHDERCEMERRIDRLQQKFLGANQVSQAKAILVRTRNVSDDDAYRIIREQAMSKRTSTEDIARAIIHADGILSFAPKAAS